MSARFLKTGIIYLILGILAGVVIHHVNERALIPLHAHVTLSAGLLNILFALIYEVFRDAGKSRLAVMHFWMFNISTLAIFSLTALKMLQSHAFTGFLEPAQGGLNAIPGFMFLVSFILFAVNVFKNVRHQQLPRSDSATLK